MMTYETFSNDIRYRISKVEASPYRTQISELCQVSKNKNS